MMGWWWRLDKMTSSNAAIEELLLSLTHPQKKILHYVQYDNGSPAKYRGSRFRSPSNSTAVLNLNHSLVFSSSRSFCTFLKKVPKTGQSCTAFGASFVQESLCDIFQSVHTSPLAACRNAWGGKNSLRSNIMPPVSKHCSATRCASQRCPSALGGELPFAMNRRVE